MLFLREYPDFFKGETSLTHGKIRLRYRLGVGASGLVNLDANILEKKFIPANMKRIELKYIV